MENTQDRESNLTTATEGVVPHAAGVNCVPNEPRCSRGILYKTLPPS